MHFFPECVALWGAICSVPEKISHDIKGLVEPSVAWAFAVQLRLIIRLYVMPGPPRGKEFYELTLSDLSINDEAFDLEFVKFKTYLQVGRKANLYRDCDGFGQLRQDMLNHLEVIRPILLRQQPEENQSNRLFLSKTGLSIQGARWSQMITNCFRKYLGTEHCGINMMRHCYFTTVMKTAHTEDEIYSIASAMLTSARTLEDHYLIQCPCERSLHGLQIGLQVFSESTTS